MDIIRRSFAIPGSREKDVALIAIGDVHGRFDLLQQIIPTAKKALPKKAKQVQFVLLGDIIDRGDAAIAEPEDGGSEPDKESADQRRDGCKSVHDRCP